MPRTDRFDCTDALWRAVDDDSPPLEKALWHAVDHLRQIDEDGPRVTHVQHVAARGLEAIERALRGDATGPATSDDERLVCICPVSEPDRDGNRDLFERDDCPIHGTEQAAR